MIGENCIIEDCFIGPYSSIGDSTHVRKSEVEYSIILRDCRILNVGIRLEGSILGNDVEVVEAQDRVAAGDERRGDVEADEAGAAGDEDPHAPPQAAGLAATACPPDSPAVPRPRPIA